MTVRHGQPAGRVVFDDDSRLVIVINRADILSVERFEDIVITLRCRENSIGVSVIGKHARDDESKVKQRNDIMHALLDEDVDVIFTRTSWHWLRTPDQP